MFKPSLILLCAVFSQFSLSQAAVIKIGVVGPRTGSAAAEGAAFDQGIALALDAIKAKGGIHGDTVEVVFEDTGGGPEKAASAFEKLVTQDKVAIVLGESHSSAALAEIEVANRYRTPFIVADHGKKLSERFSSRTL